MQKEWGPSEDWINWGDPRISKSNSFQWYLNFTIFYCLQWKELITSALQNWRKKILIFPELGQQSQCTDSYWLDNAAGAEVRKEWSYTSSQPIYFHGVDRDQFSFTLVLFPLLVAKWSIRIEWFHVLHILLIFWGLQIFINSSQRKN